MKLRRIAAALVIVSLGAASIAFGSMYAKMQDCRITEKTIVGDAAAAAGLSASFGMGLQNQLYWRNVYTYGGADDGADVQETAFSRKNPFPADKKAPVPYVRLTGYMTSGNALDDILTDPAEGYPIRQELLAQVRQEFFTAGAAGILYRRRGGAGTGDQAGAPGRRGNNAESEAQGSLSLLSDRGRSDGDVHLGSVTG